MKSGHVKSCPVVTDDSSVQLWLPFCALLVTPDIEQAYTLRHAIDLHVHESCMRVAVRVLHSCAFICVSGRRL